jgi:hypothetical protein
MLRGRASRWLGEDLPTLVRVGVVMLVLGLAADIASHVIAGGVGISAELGHVVTLAGMLLSVIGVLKVALRSKPSEQKGGEDGARSDLTIG